MAKFVTRTITTSTIHAASVKFEDGQAKTTPLAPLTVDGSVTEEQALRKVIKEYGKKNQYVITAVEKNDVLYGIPTEVFMTYAKPMDELKPAKTEEAAN